MKSGELLGTFPFTLVTEGVSSFLFVELLFSFPDPGVFGTNPSNLYMVNIARFVGKIDIWYFSYIPKTSLPLLTVVRGFAPERFSDLICT